MLMQGTVGPASSTSSLGSGAPANVRQGNLGDLIVSELHGRYYESVYRRARFGGSAVSQTTTVGAATTYVGLCLSNPNGSSVNLVLGKVGFAFLVAFAAGSVIGLMTGTSGTNVTQTTAVTPRSKFGSQAAGQGLLSSAATLPVAPVLDTVLAAGLTGAITTVPGGLGGLIDMEGSIILTPGSYVCFYTSTASGAAAAALSMEWEEVAI